MQVLFHEYEVLVLVLGLLKQDLALGLETPTFAFSALLRLSLLMEPVVEVEAPLNSGVLPHHVHLAEEALEEA